MKVSDFDYNLPPELIAQEQIKPRDHSRLLIVRRLGTIPQNCGTDHANNQELKGATIEHKHFYDIVDYLRKGDVLVLNNSKVFPARLIGKRKKTGGRLEIFLLKEIKNRTWQCLVGGRRARVGLEVEFDSDLFAVLKTDNGDGTWEAEFNKDHKEMMEVVEKIGEVPLPPYIKTKKQESKKTNNKVSYQTVYADDKKIGSVAAPTAGLHFTPELIDKLKVKGVQFEYITLHVGMGTFAPVKVENILDHKMHSEFVEIDADALSRIYLAKSEGRRIISVGTTSVRTLEAAVSKFPISNFQFPNKVQISKFEYQKQFVDIRDSVNIFIFPGYKFKIVDAMITNFHLPKSTLLMLVSAFAGKKNVDQAYQIAINEKYRFFSYGDAMFIA